MPVAVNYSGLYNSISGGSTVKKAENVSVYASLTVANYVKVSDNDLLEVVCKTDDLRVVLEVVVRES